MNSASLERAADSQHVLFRENDLAGALPVSTQLAFLGQRRCRSKRSDRLKQMPFVRDRSVGDGAFGFDPQAIHLPEVDLPAVMAP
jgi:hypothetical protein